MSSPLSFGFSNLFSRNNRLFLIILSVSMYVGTISCAVLLSCIDQTGISFEFSFGFFSRLLLMYALLTLLFVLGNSLIGFIILPGVLCAFGAFMAYSVWGVLFEDALFLSAEILPFLSLIAVACLSYGSCCMRRSHELFRTAGDGNTDLQGSIKLYCFTVTVFTLLTFLFAGFGYIISYVYRLLF